MGYNKLKFMFQKIKTSILLALLALTPSLFISQIASAASECRLNGEVVDCSEISGFLWAGFGFLGVILVIGLIMGIFWLWMLIHAISHNIENKAIWILIILVTGPIGALIYYIAIKKNLAIESQIPTENFPPTPPKTPSL